MEIYDNERDQLEAIKHFFAKYGKAISLIIVIILAAVILWHYWNDRATKSSQAISQAYQQISEKLRTEGKQATDEAAKFIASNQNIYGTLISLELAGQFIADQQLEKAAAQLQKARENTRDENLKALITLRLARIQIQQKQPDAALQALETIKTKGWDALVADVRGDALLSKGDKQGARNAWNNALQNQSSPEQRNILQIKINNLSS